MIIGISGGSGSGKSTIARTVAKKGDSLHISLDNYYLDLSKEVNPNYDSPNAFNFDLLISDIREFKLSGMMAIREYDFISKETKFIKYVNIYKTIIIEGLYSYYSTELSTLIDIKIFLDIPENIRNEQRYERDLIERDLSKVQNEEMVNKFVTPMYIKYVLKQLDLADYIYEDRQELLRFLLNFKNK